jgi:hypothetical protein
LWPHEVKRLVVVVSSLHGGHKLVAYGVDPDRHHVVFEAEFPRARLSSFIKAVIDGDKTVLACHKSRTTATAEVTVAAAFDDPVDPHVVVITDPDPKGPGPKVAVALATAIRSNELLGEASA